VKRCNGIVGFFLGHNFITAYTTRTIPPQTLDGMGGITAAAAKMLIESRTAREEKAEFTYCKRCGAKGRSEGAGNG
jgi:hypothetical protein